MNKENRDIDPSTGLAAISFEMPESIAELNIYHPKMGRSQAEAVLQKRAAGTFLLRPASIPNSLAVSYMSFEHKIRHTACQVHPDGRVSPGDKKDKVLSIEEYIFSQSGLFWGLDKIQQPTSVLKRDSQDCTVFPLSPDAIKQAIYYLNEDKYKDDNTLGFSHVELDEKSIFYVDKLQVMLCFSRLGVLLKRRYQAKDNELTSLHDRLDIPLFADEIIIVRITRSAFDELAAIGKKIGHACKLTLPTVADIEKFVHLELIPKPKSAQEIQQERIDAMKQTYARLLADTVSAQLKETIAQNLLAEMPTKIFAASTTTLSQDNMNTAILNSPIPTIDQQNTDKKKAVRFLLPLNPQV